MRGGGNEWLMCRFPSKTAKQTLLLAQISSRLNPRDRLIVSPSWVRAADREVTASGIITWVSRFLFWHGSSQEANSSVWLNAVFQRSESQGSNTTRPQTHTNKSTKEPWKQRRLVLWCSPLILIMSLHPLVIELVINLPVCVCGGETEWIILWSQGFLPLCCPGEAIWARRKLISHKHAASLNPMWPHDHTRASKVEQECSFCAKVRLVKGWDHSKTGGGSYSENQGSHVWKLFGLKTEKLLYVQHVSPSFFCPPKNAQVSYQKNNI